VSAVGLGKPDVFAGVHTFIVHHRRRNLIPRKTLTSNPIKKSLVTMQHRGGHNQHPYP
jgi:hypothetical protein